MPVIWGALGPAPAAMADTAAVEAFYRGKTINMLVATSPGGRYDVNARLIARHAPRRIPGNPAIVVENMPGAASMTSVNYVTRIGAQDGTVIGAPGTAPFFAPLTAEAHMFPDPRGLHWLPSPSSDTPVFVVWHETQVRSVADLAQHEIISGSTSKNSPTSFYGRLLAELFNAKIRIVYGYSGGTPEVLAAMEKGEVSAFTNINWASLRVMKAQLLDAGKLRVILQFGSKPSEELPATPFARDLLRSADDRELLDMAVTPYLFGRPYFLGPNVPADRIAMLRRVFAAPAKVRTFSGHRRGACGAVSAKRPHRARVIASLKASDPAILNESSLESTAWYDPS